jgi:hypothetical protein
VGSVLVLLGAAMGLMGMLLAPLSRANPPLPPFARAIAEGTIAFIMALGIFGLFSGVGLLRLKNWARIATLVWAGITVVFSALVLIGLRSCRFQLLRMRPLIWVALCG